MGAQNEDDAWRAIVENYGERPRLDPSPPAPEPEPVWFTGALADAAGSAGADDIDDPDEEGFVPPPPPPLPWPEPARLLAWLGVFGAPTVLLVGLVLGVTLPSVLGYALIGWFVGGFGYLVLHMDNTPRDPGDDGAVV
ncbi:hypothetical protein [Nocardioides taihuensis]|uniref:Uncharacterized protein n=1 Tax=Nocardioides taihuensis TaxID=1835606 RepID=A0ABW0BP98_9ACTN